MFFLNDCLGHADDRPAWRMNFFIRIFMRSFDVPTLLVAVATSAIVAGSGHAAGSANIVFPASGFAATIDGDGILDASRFGAVPDDNIDDTAALQTLISKAVRRRYRIIYLPNGVYNIRRPLTWIQTDGRYYARVRLQGQSRNRTILKLDDNAAGYADAARPQAVIYTAGSNEQAASKYLDGGGNEAFSNSIRNLTVDIGKGNPGAIGIDYQVSNQGTIRDITVKTSSYINQGYIGISMQRGDNGPGLLKNVSVIGFQKGIVIGGDQDPYSTVTLEDIALSRQTVVGLQNTSAVVAIRKLTSTNRVPAIWNYGLSLLNLIDVRLKTPSGAAVGGPAIESFRDETQYTQPYERTRAQMFVRGLVTAGYTLAIRDRANDVSGPSLAEWSSEVPLTRSGPDAGATSLNLPVLETPEYFDDNLANWAVVRARRAGETDDGNAVQEALNSGKSTVFLPDRSFLFSRTMNVPATVRHICGAFARINTVGSALAFANAANTQAVFKFTGSRVSTATTLEDVHFYTDGAGVIGVEPADARTVVVRHSELPTDENTPSLATRTAGVGKLFFEDVVTAGIRFDVPTQFWARQFNPETRNLRIDQNGGNVWLLGFKTERPGTVFRTINNGNIELLGGNFVIQGEGADPSTPSILLIDSIGSFSYAGTAFYNARSPAPYYRLGVREVRGSATFDSFAGYWRGDGTNVPLYSAKGPPVQ